MSDWNAETSEWYAKNYGDYPTNKLGINALDLLDNSTIVDIGCGTGSALRHAASKITGGKFIGVDPVPRMIEIANEETQNHDAKNRIAFRVGSAETLPVENNIADYVLAFDSIDHWQDIEKGLSEVKRILQPDGKFVVVKDNSVPGAKKAIDDLTSKLTSMDYTISDQQEISNEGVSFYIIIIKFAK